jgi:hypothetical protein
LSLAFLQSIILEHYFILLFILLFLAEQYSRERKTHFNGWESAQGRCGFMRKKASRLAGWVCGSLGDAS